MYSTVCLRLYFKHGVKLENRRKLVIIHDKMAIMN